MRLLSGDGLSNIEDTALDATNTVIDTLDFLTPEPKEQKTAAAEAADILLESGMLIPTALLIKKGLNNLREKIQQRREEKERGRGNNNNNKEPDKDPNEDKVKELTEKKLESEIKDNLDTTEKNKKKGNIYDKVYRDKKGKRKIKGFQEHHIISDKNESTKGEDLWKPTGENPESQHNKIFLPEKEENHPKRSIHRGRHWQSVSDEMRKKIEELKDKGKQENWTQEQYKDALREIQNKERQKLRNGKRDLNSINRHNSIVGK